MTYQSGVPFSVIDSAGATLFTPSSPNESLASYAPGAGISDVYTSGGVQQRLNGYVNASAFTPAPTLNNGTLFGNLYRNMFCGPLQQNWDLALNKVFSITERQQIKFGAQFFNMWNHPVFANPSFVDISGQSFGAITSTVDTPCLIQLNARYQF